MGNSKIAAEKTKNWQKIHEDVQKVIRAIELTAADRARLIAFDAYHNSRLPKPREKKEFKRWERIMISKLNEKTFLIKKAVDRACQECKIQEETAEEPPTTFISENIKGKKRTFELMDNADDEDVSKLLSSWVRYNADAKGNGKEQPTNGSFEQNGTP